MRARFLTLTVLLLTLLATAAHSAPLVEKKRERPKTVKVSFVSASWHKVFAWLFEQTGKPIRSCTPNGRFTLAGPADREYTLAEVIAQINETLASQPDQFILIEREDSFSLFPRRLVVGGQ